MKEEMVQKNAESLQIKRPLFSWMKHKELLATGLCGLLIILAYIFPNVSVPLFIFAFVIGGFHKAKEGLEDLVHKRTLNVEILMVLAAVGAGIIGYWAEGAILIFIFSLSGSLETYAMNRSERDLSRLIQLQPEEATRIRGIEHKVVSVSHLEIGDHVLVKPGERFPIDGQVIQGTSTVDESSITGEFIPVEKNIKDDVFAGTTNTSGSIVLQVSKLNHDTLFQKIVRLVQKAQQEKSRSQHFIERFEKKYVQVVLIVVALMFILPHYILSWSWSETWYRALVLLVVASPCALVASVSPAILSVLSYSARNGVLFKGGSYIEQISHIKVVAMDKTGTITTGLPQVTQIFVREDMEISHFLHFVAGLERHSGHPLAQAIVTYAEQKGVVMASFEEITDVPGKGIYGTHKESKWSIGSARFVGQEEAALFLQRVASKEELQGKTVIFVRDPHGISGAIVLQDMIREEARKAIQQLQNQNLHVTMITGDQSSVAQAIADEAGIREFTSEALPNEKMDVLITLRKKYGAVLMIGDGMNDAPSLAQADIGVAMGGGTDIALDTAEIILVKNNLFKVSETIRVAQKMNRIIKQNVTFSLIVIGFLILTNYLQLLTLPFGVIAHEGSTILVILNGLRLLRG